MKFKWLFILAFSILSITACKEKNEDFPPAPWDNYFFERENIPPRPVSAILVLNDHSEWLGSRGNEGLLHNDGYTWRIYNEANTGIPFDSVTSILSDGYGNLWVSWKNGLATFDGIHWTSLPEFRDRKVTALALQGIGIVWAAIDDERSGGLARISNGGITLFNPANSGIASTHINSLAIDPDQHIWAGSSDKGVVHFDGRYWTTYDSETLAIRSNHFNCMAVDTKGIVWAGNNSSQVVKFGTDQPAVLNTGTSLPVTKLLAGPDDKIWMSVPGFGLVTFDSNNWESYTPANVRLPGDTVISLAVNPDGKILAGFPDGHVIWFKK